MKKLFLTVAIALGTLTAINAQEAGSMWAGGVASFGSTKVNDGDRQTDFQFIPEVGYFFTDNLGVGIAIGGGHQNVSALSIDDEGQSIKSTSKNFYKVNPFLRYTFLKGDIGGLFVDAGATYAWSKLVNGGAHGHEWQVGLKPGVAVNVSNKISLLGKFGFLGYNYEKIDKNNKNDDFGFKFDMNNIELGMNIKF